MSQCVCIYLLYIYIHYATKLLGFVIIYPQPKKSGYLSGRIFVEGLETAPHIFEDSERRAVIFQP